MKILTGFLVFFSWQILTAQKILVPELNSFQGRFIHYPLTEPGADISTTRLFFDRRGFLWTGTLDGLYRYDGNNYKSIQIRNENSAGLAGHLITSIVEDSEGTKWIGTYGALNRIDRISGNIRQYIPDSTDLLSLNNRIRSIHIDKKGILWLLTCEDVFTFNRQTSRFQRYFLDGSRTEWPDKPDQLFEDSNGRIWITSDNGLFRYNQGSNSFIRFKHDPDNQFTISSNKVAVISEDRDGTLWCGTRDGGLNRIDDPERGLVSRISFKGNQGDSAEFSEILEILHDNEGSMWLFGNGSLANYVPGRGLKNQYSIRPVNKLFRNSRGHSMKFEEAMQDSSGRIWFLQKQGLLFRFDPTTEKLTLFPVPNWMVFHWLKDKADDSFWFGCANGNTWRLVINSLPYQTASVPNMFNVSIVNNPKIAQDNNNNLWLALSTGLCKVERFDPEKTFRPKQIRLPDGDTVASCLIKTSKGEIIMSSGSGNLIRVDDSGNNTLFKIEADSDTQIFNIVEDRESNIWLQGLNRIFFLRSGSDQIEEYFIKNDRLKRAILSGIFDILPDRNGNLWVATFGNGVYCCKIADNELAHYTTNNSTELINGDYCIRVMEDLNGKIWILFAYNGLYYFDTDSEVLRKVNIVENLTGSFAYIDLYIDNQNYFYVYHNQGITIVNNDSGFKRQIPFSQLPGSMCSSQLNDGSIMSLCGSEIKLFSNPAIINNIVPEVFLSGLSINETNYSSLFPEEGHLADVKKISLRHDQTKIKFELATMNFLFPENNNYRYKMSGVDNDTIFMDHCQPVEYAGLRPGRYRFWFTGSNNDNVWNKEGKSIEIIVSPPITRSVIAFITYVILFALLVTVFVLRHYRKLIYDKKLLEKEVQIRTVELEQKNREIEHLDRMKTRFFTEISHEFRTPLSLIIGPVDTLLADRGLNDNYGRNRLMKIIKRNSMRLLNLVNQLLDISRLDAGKMKITLTHSDILKDLRILICEFFSTADNRKISFNIEIPEGPFITYFDRDKVEKILSNLLSNAFKFTPENGCVTCSIEIKNEGFYESNTVLNIEVSDTGIGISRENISKIFERFYRVEGQWEKDGGGTGIGLSLTNEFITLLHGNIEVTSNIGRGTKIMVRIPLGIEHLEPSEYVIAPDTNKEDNEYKPEKEITELCTDKRYDLTAELKNPEAVMRMSQILVIEDNKDLRDFIKDSIMNEYHVYDAENGRIGVKMALSRIPDLVVTDIIMPDMDGIEVCRKLKTDERTSHIPIIILTAKAGLEDRLGGLITGADDYLSKPFDIKELKIRISNLLTQREKLRLRFESMADFDEYDSTTGTLEERFMRRVNEMIRKRIHNFDFDVGVLQEELGMSRVHLYRKLKALTGESPSSLIHRHRMKLAARMIKDKKGNLTEIALSVGISNPSYFSRSFRTYYGISPRDFANHPGRVKKAMSEQFRSV